MRAIHSLSTHFDPNPESPHLVPPIVWLDGIDRENDVEIYALDAHDLESGRQHTCDRITIHRGSQQSGPQRHEVKRQSQHPTPAANVLKHEQAAAGTQHAIEFIQRPYGIGDGAHRARADDGIERVVAKRKILRVTKRTHQLTLIRAPPRLRTSEHLGTDVDADNLLAFGKAHDVDASSHGEKKHLSLHLRKQAGLRRTPT